jgi:hypothetical protein
MVIREIVREGGGGSSTVTFPTLTKANYQEWAILMRIALQGAGLWEAVDTGDATERQERQALGAILRSVSTEIVPALTAEDNAKVAWDTLKAMRVGDNRVREARRQKLRKEFEALAFKKDEFVKDFALRVSNLLCELQTLGDKTTKLDTVQKMLHVVPPQYSQMACSIETLLDLSTLSIEELSGRLAASEGHGAPDQEDGGRLLLTAKSGPPVSSAGRAHRRAPKAAQGQNHRVEAAPRKRRVASPATMPHHDVLATAATAARRGTGPRSVGRRSAIANARSRQTFFRQTKRKALRCSWPSSPRPIASPPLHHRPSSSTKRR